MSILFPYALILGIFMSLLVFVGCVLGKRSFVLTGMIFSAIVASPITTFTRGEAGAIYASDMVAFTLLLCWLLPMTKSFICEFAPKWYKWFFRLTIAALFSVLFIAPLFPGSLQQEGLLGNVRSPIPGVPLVFLMAGFRFIRITLYFVYFLYATHMLMDEKTHRLVYKLILLAVLILAVCQIFDFLGIANLGLHLRGIEWQMAHILGQVKAAAGRLYLMGIFVTLILFYRPMFAPFYFAALGTMTIALLFNGSRAGFVGIVVGLIIVGMRIRFSGKILAAVLLALIPLAFSVLMKVSPERIQSFSLLLEGPTTNPRWVIWKWIIPYILVHPHVWFTGVGFSNFRYALVAQEVAEHAHNDFLTCITEMGFGGLILFCGFVFSFGRGIRDRIKHTTGEPMWEAVCFYGIFVGYLMTSFFESTFYFSAGLMPMQRIVAVLFGTTMAWWVQQDYMAETEDESDAELEEEFAVAQETYV